jgi:hypothetical protein
VKQLSFVRTPKGTARKHLILSGCGEGLIGLRRREAERHAALVGTPDARLFFGLNSEIGRE